MSKKTPDKFSMHVPDDKEAVRLLPSKLEVINYNPRTKQPQANLPAGAYNPYDRDRSDEDIQREKRKKVDLRRLSEWIQATQKVKVLKLEDTETTQGPVKRPAPPKKPRRR